MATVGSHSPNIMDRSHWTRRDFIILTLLCVGGAALAYVDNQLNFHTILVETVHALVVTTILVFCLISQKRNPEINQFGWNTIVLGVGLLMVGSWVDILDDPPVIALLEINGVPFGRSWEQAFIKKILGYTVGIGLVAYGFFQWVPWMIETRLNVQRMNQKLSLANKNMNRILMNRDEHVESERLRISRELHDEVAQRLTFVNVQLQLCRKILETTTDQAREKLNDLGQEISDVLKSIRQISRDLRPEPLYALGLVPALEQFIEKLTHQSPSSVLQLVYAPMSEGSRPVRLESRFSERELLHLYRLLQEGTHNALKHSQAKTITIRIEEHPDSFRFTIEDDGSGLPWKTLPEDETLVQEGHLGIVGMKERVAELSGSFNLMNREPSGAMVEIRIQK